MATIGFSFGDFVSGIRLLQNLIDALNGTFGAKAQYRGLISELYCLERALIAIKELELHEDSPGYNATQQAVRGCQECIDKFVMKIASYQSLTAGTSSIKDHIRKITWAQCRQHDLNKFKDDISMYLSAINVLLNAMQLSYSRRIDDTVSKAGAHRDTLDCAIELIKCTNMNQTEVLQRIESLLLERKVYPSHVEPGSFFVRPLRLVNAPIASNFVDRPFELTSMEEYLLPTPADIQRLLVLSGPGGVGKSQLARAYALKHQHHYDSLFWTDGRSEQSLRNSIAQMAELIPLPHVLDSTQKLPQNEGDLAKAFHAVQTWLTSAGNSQWLIIIDNVDNYTSAEKDQAGMREDEQYDVCKYIPCASQGSLIITSRLSYLAHEIGARTISLGEMRVAEALQVLHQASNRPLNEPGAEELVHKLGAYPLALMQAASYIYENRITTKIYVERYEDDLTLLINQQPARREYRHETIDVTLELSFNALKKSKPEVAAFLLFCGFLDSRDIFWEYLTVGYSGNDPYSINKEAFSVRLPQFTNLRPSWLQKILWDVQEFNKVVKVLNDLSFVRWNEESDGFSIHAVIHEWIVSYCDQYTKSQVLAVAARIAGSNFGARSEIPSQRIQRHADRCIDLVDGNNGFQNWSFYTLFLLGAFYYDTQNVELAQHLINSALQKVASAFGAESEMAVLWGMRASPMFIHTKPKDIIIQQLLRAEALLTPPSLPPNRRSQNLIEHKNHICYAYQMQGNFKKALEIGEAYVQDLSLTEFVIPVMFSCAYGLLAESYLANKEWEMAKKNAVVANKYFERQFGFDPKDGSIAAWRRRNTTIMAIASTHLGDFELAEFLLVSVHAEVVRDDGPDAALSRHAKRNLECLRKVKALRGEINQMPCEFDSRVAEAEDDRGWLSTALQDLSTDLDIIYVRWDLAFGMFDMLNYVDQKMSSRSMKSQGSNAG